MVVYMYVQQVHAQMSAGGCARFTTMSVSVQGAWAGVNSQVRRCANLRMHYLHLNTL